jgi:mono/diheme cytochrome c family protein
MRKFIFCICLMLIMNPLVLTAAEKKAVNERGKALFKSHCQVCHINRQEGDQPTAYTRQFQPPDFSNPDVWENLNKREIKLVMKKGRGVMPPQQLQPDEVEAIADYLVQRFEP